MQAALLPTATLQTLQQPNNLSPAQGHITQFLLTLYKPIKQGGKPQPACNS